MIIIENYGEKLIETVNEAEIKLLGPNPDPLNQYRTILVTEILPTVVDKWEDMSEAEQQQMSTLNEFFCGLHYIVGLSSRPG